MRERFKRGLAIATAVVYLAAGVVTPARAFAPPLILGAAAVALPSGTYAGLASLGALIGLTGLYLTLQDSYGNKAAIALTDKPESQPPAPSAPATATPTSTTTYNAGDGQVYTSFDSACNARIAYQNSRQTTSNFGMGDGITTFIRIGTSGCQVNGSWRRYSDGYIQISGPFDFTPGSTPGVTTCPTGYTLSNGACNLTNPRQAADDKRCDMLKAGGQFAMADDLNCSSTADGTKLQPLLRDGKVIAYGKNETTGEPLIFTVSPSVTVNNRDWTQIKIQEQVQTATQTQVKESTIQIDPQTGTITSVQTQTSPGTIQTPTTTTVPTTNMSTTVDNSPTVKTDTTKNIDFSTCGLPGQPACAVDDTGFGNQAKPWDSAVKPDFDTGKKAITEWVDPSLSWPDLLPKLTPGSYTACHPLEFRGQVQQYGLDATTQLDICWFFEYIRMFLGYLFGLSAMVYIFRTFTSSQSWGK